jgi:hypothetical protein
MISETWEQEQGKPMFIDRDSDLFAQVLNYLRYGSIELPVTITPAMFQRELDYYAIPAADGSVTHVKKKSIAQNTLDHKLFSLAEECYNCFRKNLTPVNQGLPGSVRFLLTKEDHGELYGHFAHSHFPEDSIKQLNDYLDLFGLQVSVNVTLHKDNNFSVFVKK